MSTPNNSAGCTNHTGTGWRTEGRGEKYKEGLFCWKFMLCVQARTRQSWALLLRCRDSYMSHTGGLTANNNNKSKKPIYLSAVFSPKPAKDYQKVHKNLMYWAKQPTNRPVWEKPSAPAVHSWFSCPGACTGLSLAALAAPALLSWVLPETFQGGYKLRSWGWAPPDRGTTKSVNLAGPRHPNPTSWSP